jgi:hypothetical protein
LSTLVVGTEANAKAMNQPSALVVPHQNPRRITAAEFGF